MTFHPADKAKSFLLWINAVFDGESENPYELIDLRDGYIIANNLCSSLKRSMAGIVPKVDCLFNSSLRMNNLKRIVMMLEEFYSMVHKRTIAFNNFDLNCMASGTTLDIHSFNILLELGNTFR